MVIQNGVYSVYVHLNNVNGKVYVGMTRHSLRHRWGPNGEGYKTQQYFWRAIQKYGWDSFEHFVFAEHLTADEAANIERILIKELRANEKEFGYNIEPGGQIMSDRMRERIGDAERGHRHHYYGKHRDPETCKKISESLSGEKHYWFGKHLPEETRRKISESNKGRKKPESAGTQPRPVVCVETGTVYPSTAEASRAVQTHHSGITMVQRGRRQTAGGYHWIYFDSDKTKSLTTSL